MNHLKPAEQVSTLYLTETPVFDEIGRDVTGDDLQTVVHVGKFAYCDVQFR